MLAYVLFPFEISLFNMCDANVPMSINLIHSNISQELDEARASSI